MLGGFSSEFVVFWMILRLLYKALNRDVEGKGDPGIIGSSVMDMTTLPPLVQHIV